MQSFLIREHRIEWGQCDPAGIVFAPRFIDMFAESTILLFEAAGLPRKRDMLDQMGVVGFPLVDLSARFTSPASYGDVVRIEADAPIFGNSSFTIAHRILLGDRLCVEGTEKRVWTVASPGSPSGLRSAPVPQDVRARFAGSQ
ncbi:thioesterase family protein [Novosphingobium sp. PY1]|uniref:acyl-CoA thioesterase n=1 Tax=Novosphingobium sp. PY1 TaxID=1882221 RepID=UPI001A8D8BFF|nr:thioesterase family protein [Novosphingobium sp. PY1]GFM27579.1 4-hydroxybenzoyl-CoA thioesterase [Novosphingobium sp. PY1]